MTKALETILLVIILSVQTSQLRGQSSPKVPRSVHALWADIDPRKEHLEDQVVREWENDGITYRYVTYHIATFKGKKARMAAFFGFPKGGKKLPGLLHLHGGGQRAFLHEVEFYAKKGYACLSINWGGREMENVEPDDPNTDWGTVDPTQKNVPGYFNLMPGDKYLDPFESPRNNNWYLLTIGARRGLTFLERQPQVDAGRLGVYGHSMGGNLTVYVAGTDSRVKVAAPSAGGQGFRTFAWPFLLEQRKQRPKGDMELFRSTLGFQSYAPHITAPLLWLGATNDFHGIMDDTYRTGALIPHQDVQYSFTPHMNHRFTPEFAVTRPLWLDQHLKRGMKIPSTPKSNLSLSNDNGVPVFEVAPDLSQRVAKVNIFYSIDPDPQARFWRSAPAKRIGATWKAQLPVLSLQKPLVAFANVHYQIDNTRAAPFARSTSSFAISSVVHTASPAELRKRKIKPTDKPSLLIDDFSHGWRDWYLLSGDNPHHWQFWTRKITDPKWRGPKGYKLSFDVQVEKPNELIVVITENFFRSYRGRKVDFVAVVALNGGGWEPVNVAPADFKSVEGRSMRNWQHADLLGFRAYYNEKRGEAKFGTTKWAGARPTFRNLRWGGTRVEG